MQPAWKLVLLIISFFELRSIFSFDAPVGLSGWWSLLSNEGADPKVEQSPFSIRGGDREPGDLGFDPLNLKPKGASELKDMQAKELNHGRLAMIATAGMVAQELATGEKLF